MGNWVLYLCIPPAQAGGFIVLEQISSFWELLAPGVTVWSGKQLLACLFGLREAGRLFLASEKKGGGLDAGLSISGVVFRAGVAEVCLLAELVGVSK